MKMNDSGNIFTQFFAWVSPQQVETHDPTKVTLHPLAVSRITTKSWNDS